MSDWHVQCGRDAMVVGASVPAPTAEGLDDPETYLTDTLANLMHAATAEGVSFDACLGAARMQWDEQR